MKKKILPLIALILACAVPARAGDGQLAALERSLAAFKAERQARRLEIEGWWRRHTEGAPYTGRHRVIIIPEKDEVKLADLLYKRLLSGSVPSRDEARRAQLERVGARLIAAAARPDWDWELKLLDEAPTSAFGVAGDQDKAFALTGGKVGVLLGLADAAGDDAGLAAVLSHEIAHAVARHLGEKLSEAILLEAGMTAAGMLVPPALAVAIPMIAPAAIGAARLVALAQAAYGFGTPQGKRLLVARFSKTQEEEADRIGLILMAKAGYEPQKAVDFWASLVQQAPPARPGLSSLIQRHLALHAVAAGRVEALRAIAPAVRAQYFTEVN